MEEAFRPLLANPDSIRTARYAAFQSTREEEEPENGSRYWRNRCRCSCRPHQLHRPRGSVTHMADLESPLTTKSLRIDARQSEEPPPLQSNRDSPAEAWRGRGLRVMGESSGLDADADRGDPTQSSSTGGKHRVRSGDVRVAFAHVEGARRGVRGRDWGTRWGITIRDAQSSGWLNPNL